MNAAKPSPSAYVVFEHAEHISPSYPSTGWKVPCPQSEHPFPACRWPTGQPGEGGGGEGGGYMGGGGADAGAGAGESDAAIVPRKPSKHSAKPSLWHIRRLDVQKPLPPPPLPLHVLLLHAHWKVLRDLGRASRTSSAARQPDRACRACRAFRRIRGIFNARPARRAVLGRAGGLPVCQTSRSRRCTVN